MDASHFCDKGLLLILSCSLVLLSGCTSTEPQTYYAKYYSHNGSFLFMDVLDSSRNSNNVSYMVVSNLSREHAMILDDYRLTYTMSTLKYLRGDIDNFIYYNENSHFSGDDCNLKFKTTYGDGGDTWEMLIRNDRELLAFRYNNISLCPNVAHLKYYDCRYLFAVYSQNKSYCTHNYYITYGNIDNPFYALSCEDAVDIYGNKTLLGMEPAIPLSEFAVAHQLSVDYSVISRYIHDCDHTIDDLRSASPPPRGGPGYKPGEYSFNLGLTKFHCIFC